MLNEQNLTPEAANAAASRDTSAPGGCEPAAHEPKSVAGVCSDIGALPPGAIVTEDGLAAMMGKCRMSIRRAVKRGELPPAARVMGKRCWTAGAIVRHMERRLEAAADKTAKAEKRIAQLPT